MQEFKQHTGLAVPLDSANVDTDQIIPKQFLQRVSKLGFGQNLFHDWRFLDDAGTQPNPEFVLNFPRYKGASILLARENFGNGSSREHAPWALADYGLKAVIAFSLFAVTSTLLSSFTCPSANAVCPKKAKDNDDARRVRVKVCFCCCCIIESLPVESLLAIDNYSQ